MRLKIAIILPPGSRFSKARPNSMETVVRTLAEATGPDQTLRVFCEEGADDHGALDVCTIPGGRRRVAHVVAALKHWAPDLIEFHQQTHSASTIARRFTRTARLLYRHNDIRIPRSPITRWRHQRRYRPFDGLVFVSEASRDAFMSDYPMFRDRAFAIRNPIDTQLWRADAGGREDLIVFSGRAIPEKGLGLLCEALPPLLARRHEWRAQLFLGDWNTHQWWAMPHVQRLMNRTDRVSIAYDAPLAVVREVMQRASIAVTPSTWAEPLGLTALEAHAAGLALVSSGRGGLREASGAHALYIDPLTSDGVTSALETLIDNPERRRDLALAGQAFVETEHTPSRRAEELAALRRSLIEERARSYGTTGTA